MPSWRPKAAWTTYLSDRDLAKLGLLTQLEVQVYQGISIALKGLEGLDLNQWVRLDRTPLEQLVARLIKAAEGVDDELEKLINEFESKRPNVLPLRHDNVHSLWGWNEADAMPGGVRRRQRDKLSVSDLDAALTALAALSFESKAVAFRVGQLIRVGRLKAGNSPKAPRMFVEGEWIQF